MSETAMLWGLGIIVAWNSALSVATFNLSMSVTRITATLVIISKRAAEILHHSDDRYKIDHLLEKYIERQHELSIDEWKELLKKTGLIMTDRNIAHDERLAAALIHDLAQLCNELSKHKLKPFPVPTPNADI